MDNQEDQSKKVRSFSRLVSVLADGQIEHELTEAMERLTKEIMVQACEHGGSPSGSITLKLGFKLDGKTIDVKASKSVAMPEAPLPKTSFWATAKNELTLENPQQGKLFRDVAAAPRQYKEEA